MLQNFFTFGFIDGKNKNNIKICIIFLHQIFESFYFTLSLIQLVK